MQAQALECKHAALEVEYAEARQSLGGLSEQLKRSAELMASLEQASTAQQAQQAEFVSRVEAAEAAAAEQADELQRAQELLQQREADCAAVQRQAEGLAAQLAAAQEHTVRAQVGGLQALAISCWAFCSTFFADSAAHKACSFRAEILWPAVLQVGEEDARESLSQATARADALEAQLREAADERDEAVQVRAVALCSTRCSSLRLGASFLLSPILNLCREGTYPPLPLCLHAL